MIEIDLGRSCTDKRCIDRVASMSNILKRDTNLWGLPCILDLSKDYWNKVLGSKERNMVRKAKKHNIQIRIDNRNIYLQDVYEINTSALFRQKKIMKESYLAFPKEETFEFSCPVHGNTWIGAFINEKLIAYVALGFHNELVVMYGILGHFKYQNTGVMNYIVSYAASVPTPNVKYMLYDFWNSGTDGLRHFKYSMGFRPMAVREKIGGVV